MPLTAGPMLRPRKLAVITSYTNEQANSSNIEQFVRVAIGEASALALDARMFSAVADDGAGPAGILNGLLRRRFTSALRFGLHPVRHR
jgi:hypothetical protein